MILPNGKMCPITGGEKPCLGELCAWFNEKAGMCGVLSVPDPIEIVAKPSTAKTTKAKATPKA